jgi:hypothetical protein
MGFRRFRAFSPVYLHIKPRFYPLFSWLDNLPYYNYSLLPLPNYLTAKIKTRLCGNFWFHTQNGLINLSLLNINLWLNKVLPLIFRLSRIIS